MSYAVGNRIGSFEITGVLGAGGMGEVYRARDARLAREVAIKVIAEDFKSDHDRIARVEREARTLAALNHPNIATLFSVEEAAGQLVLVMELVEGDTLAERISSAAARASGPAMALDQVLDIAGQIADALQAAHEHGIVHRDLKPANVKITDEGQVKVLDFGLAKATGSDSSSSLAPENSPTLSAMATQAGVILGTAGYMSPEQARGARVDARSDVFSFGVVLYEMLVLRPPFSGDTVADIVAAVLTREPDLTALPREAEPRLHDLVRRCLEKQPRRRWQAIGDVRYELGVIAAGLREPGPTVGVGPAASAHSWKSAFIGLAALTAIGFFLGLSWIASPTSTALPVTRFTIAWDAKQQLTNETRPAIAISADGTKLAYIADRQIYLRSLSELEGRLIPATANTNPASLAFSPDGHSLAFMQDGVIKRLDLASGTTFTVTPSPRNDGGLGITWSGDALYYAEANTVRRVAATGGQPEVLVQLQRGETAFRPQLLPDGETLLFTHAPSGVVGRRWDGAAVVAYSLTTGKRTILVEGGSDARYLPSGHLIYAVGGAVLARSFDPVRLAVTGDAVPVIEGVRRGIGGLGSATAQLGVSNTGTLVYIAGPVAPRGEGELLLSFFDRSGAASLLQLPPGPYTNPRMSPDGRYLAFQRNDAEQVSIWIFDLRGSGSARRLTFGGHDRYPVWTADSQHVAFQSDRDGGFGVFLQRADGTGAAEGLTTPEKGVAHVPLSASPDGSVLLVDQVGNSGVTLMAVSLKDRSTRPYGGVVSSTATGATFSPDGRQVAYSVRDRGRTSNVVFIQPNPPSGAKWQVSDNSEDGHHPAWASDGTELFYASGPGNSLTAVKVSSTTPLTFAAGVSITGPFRNGPPESSRTYDVARGADLLIGVTQTARPGESAEPHRIHVTLNWFEELRTRVPVR